jgi:hypothetical protein
MDDGSLKRLTAKNRASLTKAGRPLPNTDQGLSVAEYTEILQIAQNNPAVREKILQRIK